MTDNPLSHLQFCLLGSPQIRCNGAIYTGLTAAKAQALLYYLAMTGLDGRPTHSRAVLAPLLWGECGDSDARGNLRKAIQYLRDQFDPYLQIDNQMLGLRATAPYTVDAVAFAQAMTNPRTAPLDQLQAAIALYHGDFLDGFYVRDAPDFEAWMLAERARLRELMLQGVETLALRYADQGDLPQAITTARRLLTLEPWREETHRQLMTWLAQNGQRSAALAQYEICCHALREELAVEPSQATRDLYTRLLDQEERTVASATTAVITTEYMLVGRQQEWQTLQAAWTKTMRTGAHFVCIAGEAGIGKTRLAEELLVYAQRQGYATVRTRTYALEGRLPYGPVAAWLRTETLQCNLTKLNKVWVSEIARLLPELLIEQPDLSPQPLTARWQQKRLFEALVQAFTIDQHPLLLLLDDLQWCDLETLDWVQYLLSAAPQARLLVVGTVRSEEVEDDHPLHKLWRHLLREEKLSTLELAPLSADETALLGAQVAKQAFRGEAAKQLYQETAGNPLFIIESVRARGGEAGVNGSYQTPFTSMGGAGNTDGRRRLPTKVFAVIQARLAQLSSAARTLAHLAATVGSAFTIELLQQAGQHDEEVIVAALDELWQRRIIRQHGPNEFDFSHDRVREVAYGELSPFQMRLHHRRLAKAYERIGGERGPVSSQLAYHWERAGDSTKAIEYYQLATEHAEQIFAYTEVIAHLQRSLALLETLPNRTDYSERELAMLDKLALAFRATEGWASTGAEQMHLRLLDLSTQLGAPKWRCKALSGLRTVYQDRAEFRKALAFALQLVEQVEALGERRPLSNAHNLLAATYFHMGEFATAWQHFEQATFYERWTHSLIRRAILIWLKGYPDQARQCMAEGLALVQAHADPQELALALSLDYKLAYCLRDFAGMDSRLASLVTLANQYDFAYYKAKNAYYRGWQLGREGAGEQALASFAVGAAMLD